MARFGLVAASVAALVAVGCDKAPEPQAADQGRVTAPAVVASPANCAWWRWAA